MEKTTKEDVAWDSTVENNFPSKESENDIKDDIEESQVENVGNEWSEAVPEKVGGEKAQDIPHETSEEAPQTFPEEIRQDVQQELLSEMPQKIPVEIPYEKPSEIPEKREVTPVTTEKRVNWQELDNDIRTNFENMDTSNGKQLNEQTSETTEPIYLNNRPPLKETVIEIEDEESIAKEQSYNSMNQGIFDTPRNFEILKNPGRQEAQVEPSTASSCTFPRECPSISTGFYFLFYFFFEKRPYTCLFYRQ